MAPTLSAETLAYLLQLVRDELVLRDRIPQAKRAADELARYEAAASLPDRYTLARVAPDRWCIGAGDGVALVERSAGASEIGRGLGLLELLVAWPNDSVRVTPFMEPGRDFDDLAQSARTMMSRTRHWIGDQADIGLADLLKAVTVAEDAWGNVAATYAPAMDAPPIATSYCRSL